MAVEGGPLVGEVGLAVGLPYSVDGVAMRHAAIQWQETVWGMTLERRGGFWGQVGQSKRPKLP